MFCEELEALMEAALADGEITPKERSVLIKKAQALGVDPDEMEVVLDARLYKMKKAATPPPPPPMPYMAQPRRKSEKYGDLRKCPACGALLGATDAVCPQCGHEMVGIKAVSSAQRLADMLAEVDAEEPSLLTIFTPKDIWRKKSIIENFPVPNSKEDLVEFALTMRSRMDGPLAEACYNRSYEKKYKEVIAKLRFLFPDDPAVQRILEEDKKKKKGFFGF